MEKIGLTIGKFAPFHKGHEFLIKTALQEVNQLYVMIYETDVIDTPLEVRKKWIKAQFHQVELIDATNPPKQYGMDKESIKIQTTYIEDKVKNLKITHFYSCEPYGEYVAKSLNATNRKLEKIEKQLPLCATTLRKNIKEYKKYVNNLVYKEYIKYN